MADERFRRRETVRAGAAVAACLDTLAYNAEGHDRAGYVWNRIAGDRGRRHTMGLYVEEREGGDPVLHVYVDSSPLVQEFQTDHILYEQRLRWSGFPVDRVVFALSRKTGAPRRDRAEGEGPKEPPELPPLTDGERARVESCCRDLPDGLRQQAEAAMAASLRRERARCEGR